MRPQSSDWRVQGARILRRFPSASRHLADAGQSMIDGVDWAAAGMTRFVTSGGRIAPPEHG